MLSFLLFLTEIHVRWLLWHTAKLTFKGAFVWGQSRIRIIAIMRASVSLGAILIRSVIPVTCVAGGIVGAREMKFWRLRRQKRAAKPREIPPARELGYFGYRPLLPPH